MKKILIVGATSAIATACARLWAVQGAKLFLVGRNSAKLECAAADLCVRGAVGAHSWQLDFGDVSSYREMTEQAVQTLGGLDIALIAHGTLPDQRACEQDPLLALRDFAINGTSVIGLLTVLANQLEQQGSGKIAVISSVAGERGRSSNYFYGSAKAAISVFCEGLRARLFRSGVSVTDIRPGFVATPMTEGLPLPSLLVAQPDAVARKIIAGIDRGVNVLYVPAFWSLAMMIIRNIPGFMFKRMNL